MFFLRGRLVAIRRGSVVVNPGTGGVRLRAGQARGLSCKSPGAMVRLCRIRDTLGAAFPGSMSVFPDSTCAPESAYLWNAAVEATRACLAK